MAKVDAIRESCFTRFRPIVMTSVSVMLGNLPLALALEPGSGSRASLGIVIIGGVFSSLVLTLLLVPNVYLWLAPGDKSFREHAPPPPENERPQPTLAPATNGNRHPALRGSSA
jgi:Cu/Ag efflux pump CusA